MSMFENKTKPELERGNYIAYADEPGMVVSSGGGGEPYEMTFIATLIAGTLADYATIPFFKINGEGITGFEDVTVPDGQATYKKTVTVNPGSVVEPNSEIDGYTLDDCFGCYEALFMGNVVLEDASGPFAVIADKKTAEWYTALEEMEAPTITASYKQGL